MVVRTGYTDEIEVYAKFKGENGYYHKWVVKTVRDFHKDLTKNMRRCAGCGTHDIRIHKESKTGTKAHAEHRFARDAEKCVRSPYGKNQKPVELG